MRDAALVIVSRSVPAALAEVSTVPKAQCVSVRRLTPTGGASLFWLYCGGCNYSQYSQWG